MVPKNRFIEKVPFEHPKNMLKLMDNKIRY